MQKRCNGAKRNGIFSKCLRWICKCYVFQRNAITSNCLSVAKSHPAGMQICYAIFAGISLRLCSISLRSFRITFAAYLPTHIKSLWDFFPIIVISYWISIIWSGREISRPYHAKPFWEDWYILPFLFWGGGFAPILAKFIVFLHLKILMRLDNELLMNLLAVAFGKSW